MIGVACSFAPLLGLWLLAACTGPEVDGVRFACTRHAECGAGWYCAPERYCARRDDDADTSCSDCNDPWELCGDCVDNDGDGATDDAGCATVRPLRISGTTEPLPAGLPLVVSFDHAALVNAGEADASGGDVRLAWRDDSGALVDLDRVLDPASAWNGADTRLWFALQAALGAAEVVEGRYLLVTGVGDDDAPDDAAAVFPRADFFARRDSAQLGGDWIEHDNGGTVAIVGGALSFSTSKGTGVGPAASWPLGPIARGRWLVHVGFAFDLPTDLTYTVLVQLGADALLAAPPAAGPWDTGVVTGLAWTRVGLPAVPPQLGLLTSGGHQDLGAFAGGRHAIDLALDLDDAVATVALDGGRPSEAVAFAAAGPITTLRLMALDLDLTGTKLHGFDELYLRPLPTSGALPAVEVLPPHLCVM